jgi:hypothetical protein
MEHVLAMTGSAKALGYRTEVSYEEKVEVSKAGLIEIPAPTFIDDLFANLFSVALECFNFAEITAMELAPLGTYRADYAAGVSVDQLRKRRHGD